MEHPDLIYNKCLAYIILYQNKKTSFKLYLEELIQYFEDELSVIINHIIHHLNDEDQWNYYVSLRNQFIIRFKITILSRCKMNPLDPSPIAYMKRMNNHIIHKFLNETSLQLKKYIRCIIFIDQMYDDFQHDIHYQIQGNLVQGKEIIYSNVVKLNPIEELDDINHLPPKKRYRK